MAELDIRIDYDRHWPTPSRGFWRGDWPIIVDGKPASIWSTEPYRGTINEAWERVIDSAKRFPRHIQYLGDNPAS